MKLNEIIERYSINPCTDPKKLITDKKTGKNATAELTTAKGWQYWRFRDRSEKRYYNLASLVWLISRRFPHTTGCSHAQSATLYRASRSGNNWHSTNICTKYTNEPPKIFTENVIEHPLEPALQWNETLKLWQCLFMYNGSWCFLGLYPEVNQAAKAHICFKLWAKQTSYYERTHLRQRIDRYERRNRKKRLISLQKRLSGEWTSRKLVKISLSRLF